MVFICAICGSDMVRRPSAAPKYCSRACKGKAMRSLTGSDAPNWRGGTTIDKDGYILVHTPDHPLCDNKGYVREHRLVVEARYVKGIYLPTDQDVHHLDGNKQNNCDANLIVLSHKDHLRLHSYLRSRNSKGQLN